MNTQSTNPPSAPTHPNVTVIGINPGTAGCQAIFFAIVGLPFFAYIAPGKILRGLVVQLMYWGALAAAFVVPGLLGAAASSAADPEHQTAAAGGALMLIPLAMGGVWLAGVVFTMIDINKLVKAHNSGTGVRYT